MTPSLGNVPINLPVLLESRMLVQANSGAGKSWTLRRILEQTAAGVQQLVIDPEGEFASLRETARLHRVRPARRRRGGNTADCRAAGSRAVGVRHVRHP
jgi:DNA helicase HerA-like ATPase